MSDTPAEGGAAPDDRATLHRLGYAQELYRSMGGFQNFAISFTIISILAGCLTSYYIGFSQGGPIAITWGWLIVGVACTFVAMAMGEIASTYPTAGGLYFWASKLGGPGWGWFTGWFNLIGQIAVTAAIGFGCAIFMTSLLHLWWSYPNSFGWIYFLYAIIMLGAGLINMFKVSVTAVLNTFSAWWHMVGVLTIVVILFAVPDHHQSFGYVFGQTVNNTGLGGTTTHGFIYIYVFLTGLLLSQYTITGYDASAHMSEETRSASLGAAWGMIMSVVVSVVFGFILLVAVTFAVPDVQGTLGAVSNAVPYIWENSMSRKWAEFLLFIACVAQLFCTIASVTSASRMMFAFSRDGAVPGWRLWRKITKRERVPVNAVLAISVLSWALMIPTWWNAYVGYLVGTSIAVIGLYIAFGLPILLRLRHGEKFERGEFSLGRHYKWIGWAAVIWIAFICLLFLMPTAAAGVPWRDEWDWNFANYAPATVGGALVLFGGWWVVSAHNWFTGPRRQGDEAELERIEAEYERPGRPAPDVA